MANPFTVYKAVDGTVFETAAEQEAHDALVTNKQKIDAFVDKHFPVPAPEPVMNDDGSPKLDAEGKPVTKAKSNNARGPVRKALALWLAENA